MRRPGNSTVRMAACGSATMAGKTWKANPGLQGQSIRAFAQAPSDPRILFAGTLQGVFRSSDAGGSWQQISPTGSQEIHEVESLAVDPKDPRHRLRRHLAFALEDLRRRQELGEHQAGRDRRLRRVLDHRRSRAAEHRLCQRVQRHLQERRMPARCSRRSRESPPPRAARACCGRIPVHRDTVYAGTTEGLYKTTDGGKNFPAHDRSGRDRQRRLCRSARIPIAFCWPPIAAACWPAAMPAVSFKESNHGFSARKVEALLVDPDNPSRVYAGVVNDKTLRRRICLRRRRQPVEADRRAAWTGATFSRWRKSADGTRSGRHQQRHLSPWTPSHAWKPKNTIANTIAQARCPGGPRQST